MATKKTKKEPVIQTYEVLSPLRYGDVLYEAGDSIDLDSSEADELVKAGVLKAPKEATEPAAE
jgi:hypothetical protein